ncbi:MAG: hypothetical protein IT326_03415 [Anaerolineae bacterium]|nr:hypothetical protein [Anaerolineae bacterium]
MNPSDSIPGGPARLSLSPGTVALAAGLLLIGAIFRIVSLGSVPAGMLPEELYNAQVGSSLLQGNFSLIYTDGIGSLQAAYPALLALNRAIFGSGLILWRMPSVWVGMLVLSLTFRVAHRLSGPRLALAALALMAVAPWPVWLSRSMLHAMLAPLAGPIVLYLTLTALQARRASAANMWFTLLGMALAAAQYLHGTSWALIVMVAGMVAYHVLISRGSLRRIALNLAYVCALVTVLCLPLIIYLLYASLNPAGLLPVRTGPPAEIPGRVLVIVTGFILSTPTPTVEALPGMLIMGPLGALIFVIGLGFAGARWRKAENGFLLIWLLGGVAPVLLYPATPDFHVTGLVLPAVVIVCAIGLDVAVRLAASRVSTTRAGLRWIVSAGIATLVILISGGWTFREMFAADRAEMVTQAYQGRLAALARYLDTSRDPSPIALCSIPVDTRLNPYALAERETLAYFMHRQALPIRTFDCTSSVVLTSQRGEQRLIFPKGYYASLPGPLLGWVQNARDEAVPGLGYGVILRLDPAELLAEHTVGALMEAPVSTPPEAGGGVALTLPVAFSENMTFLGYEIPRARVRPGEILGVLTYWRVDGPLPPGVIQFTHLLSNPVLVLAQADLFSAQTETLAGGDVVVQYTRVVVPAGATDGRYTLSVGLYTTTDNRRLSVEPLTSPAVTRLFLQPVEVRR